MQQQQIYNNELHEDFQDTKDLNDIKNELIQTNEIMQNIILLLDQQNEMFDNIEINVENTHVNIEHGIKELNQASISKNNTRKNIITITGFTITGAVIGASGGLAVGAISSHILLSSFGGSIIGTGIGYLSGTIKVSVDNISSFFSFKK